MVNIENRIDSEQLTLHSPGGYELAVPERVLSVSERVWDEAPLAPELGSKALDLAALYGSTTLGGELFWPTHL